MVAVDYKEGFPTLMQVVNSHILKALQISKGNKTRTLILEKNQYKVG
jgi:hypothetical protein